MTARRDSGQVSVLVVVMVLTMVMFAGLVFDGGRLLAARRRAADVADGAARAAAQAVSIDELRGPTNAQVLTGAEAQALGEAYVARAGMAGVVTVDGDTVTVTVSDTVPMVILGLGGLWSRTVEGSGTARTVRGITTASGVP